MDQSDLVIRFCCKTCGQKIRVPEIRAGKKGRCPRCKKAVVVPKVKGPEFVAAQNGSGAANHSEWDLSFLDIPSQTKAPAHSPGIDRVSERSPEQITCRDQEQAMYLTYIGARGEAEQPAKRKYPWLIDIFLYPISVSGLTILGMVIGIPLILHFLAQLFSFVALQAAVFLIFFVLCMVAFWLVSIVLGLYMLWYFCECIRDSAIGGLRAPDTSALTPGMGELLWRMIRLLIFLVLFAAPALIYLKYTLRVDTFFWLLLAGAVFFLPMALLAMIMFDSLRALNPILIIGSIFSTILPYLGLVLFFYALYSIPVIAIISQQKRIGLPSPIALFAIVVISIYLLPVGGHLLGRFYWRYQEKLNWEV